MPRDTEAPRKLQGKPQGERASHWRGLTPHEKKIENSASSSDMMRVYMGKMNAPSVAQIAQNQLIKPRLQALRAMADVSGAELDRLTHTQNGRTATIEMRSERGGGISTKTAILLSEVFGVGIEYLCGGKGEEPNVDAVRASVARARAGYEAFELAERERLAREGKATRCPKCGHYFPLLNGSPGQ